MPPAPAGIIEMHYTPVTDYLLWSSGAGVVLRQAWQRSDYYAMFYSVPAYHADLQWAYHAYLKDTGLQDSALMQGFLAMSAFPGERCLTRYEAELAQPSFWGVVLGGAFPNLVQSATLRLTYSACDAGYQVPNPTPEKKLIP